MAELAEYLGKGGVFNLLEGVSDVLIKFDFTGAGAAFKEIQNLSLAFRQFYCAVVKLTDFAEYIK